MSGQKLSSCQTVGYYITNIIKKKKNDSNLSAPSSFSFPKIFLTESWFYSFIRLKLWVEDKENNKNKWMKNCREIITGPELSRRIITSA